MGNTRQLSETIRKLCNAVGWLVANICFQYLANRTLGTSLTGLIGRNNIVWCANSVNTSSSLVPSRPADSDNVI